MSSFSPQLTEWLARYHSFVNAGERTASATGGRSLGPASGHLGDTYPFLVPCGFTGLFAGLCLSGLPHDTRHVLIQQYVSRQGFRPVASGPFSGTGWQHMTGEDWSKLDPTRYAPVTFLPTPTHPVDLQFLVDGTLYRTSTWQYSQRDLSMNYRLHTWWLPNGLVVTAVTFISCSETLAPFLSPCFVEESGVELDPVCLFPASGTVRLFRGTTVLTADEQITLAVETTTTASENEESKQEPMTIVTVSRSESGRGQPLRSVLGVTPNSQGYLFLTSTGAHQLVRNYEELDPKRHLVTLVPNTLFLQSMDQPCCSCDDYVTAYETLRDLYEKQEQLIHRYNDTFDLLKALRDRMKEAMQDRLQPVRLRRGTIERVTNKGSSLVRCEYTVIYSNLFEQEQEFPARTLQLVIGQGSVRLTDVRIKQFPRDSGFHIIAFTDSEIHLSSVDIPGLSHQAVRLLLELETGDDEIEPLFHLIVLP